MTILSVERADSLNQFRLKFNELAEFMGDVDTSSPFQTIQELVNQNTSDINNLVIPFQTIQELVNQNTSDINNLVIPFYNSSGDSKDIPLKIVTT